ncbi:MULTISPECIES: sensor histidine kinase [unclassified Streptomyces]|uniref:sensor histidine kinase n=1 Tax=unclassified Streptomyces TaxID=2593676 RepID=UPI000365691F|nr:MULTISPECIES: sensor histidine kinase [unclassified Streptomyces]MYT30084.1 sensor histidine kinase [Streptomyces sp. SID8354]
MTRSDRWPPGRLARARARAAFLCTGVPLHGAAFLLWVWFSLTVVYAPAGAVVPLIFAVAGAMAVTWLQRRRFAAYADTGIPRTPPVQAPNDLRRAWGRLRTGAYWRQLAYHQLAGPALGVVEAVALGLWVGTIGGITYYAWYWLLPRHWAFVQWSDVDGWKMAVVGLVVLPFLPRLTGALIRTESVIARRLLGPSRAEELERRVEDLAERRAETLAAADAERRRIERDLHDGAQQRLVSLAVNLGLARATLTDLPPEARAVIDDAHREAKEALEELNHLVRGLHPHVLDDRGLDAALSGIAARAPLPVHVSVDVSERAAPAVEAVAYFVVSEALANVTKHARASRAEVAVVRAGDTLRVRVTDDGRGGADPSGGTGLTGLAHRVASVDGTLAIDSPPGGPTVVTVELPCTLPSAL